MPLAHFLVLAAGRLAAGLLGSSAPAAVGGPPSPRPTTEATAPVIAYDAVAATADVDAILGEPNRAYLTARARLVAHPELGRTALLARIDAVPPPAAGERKRLFDVLAEIGGAVAAERIAAELRHACAAEPSESGKVAAVEPWRPLLRDQGAHGRDAVASLVADRDLPVTVRATLLDDLVGITPDGDVTGLLVLAGRGHVELRRQFARSLRRRLRGNEPLRDAVLAVLDAELAVVDASRLAQVIQLRTAIEGGIDDAFLARLAALAREATRPFGVRVASVRALVSQAEHPAARDALLGVATASLPARTQADEILASLALPAVPAESAASLVRAHRLERAPTPRLASIAWAHVELRGDDWLEPGLGDPWPEVRAAALGRVIGPCPRKIVARVGGLVGRASAGADADATVQRAAIDALGRCADDAAFALLRGMLDDDAVALEQSGEAARELARHFGERGSDAVAKQLATRPERGYARRLAQALRHAEAPTERVRATLCAWVDEGGEVGSAAAASLAALYDDDAVCD